MLRIRKPYGSCYARFIIPTDTVYTVNPDATHQEYHGFIIYQGNHTLTPKSMLHRTNRPEKYPLFSNTCARGLQ